MKPSPGLCGIDEAGRGPLAGPLVMAGVCLDTPIEGLDDSKKLTERRREALYETIVAHARWHIVTIEVVDIDADGLSASLRRGLEAILHAIEAERYLFDGPTTFGVAGLECLVKADAKVAEVAAASILAKVTRDRLMRDMAARYPEYGFEKHKGYGTRAHLDAIARHGLSPIHRKSFRIKTRRQPTLL